MAIIYHKNEEYDIKRAIFYGCSNTAGSELADAEIFDMSLKEVNALKMRYGPARWNQILFSRVSLFLDNETTETAMDRYIKMCNEYSYARHLSDMLSVEYVNFAEPGTSQKRMLFKIMSDIVNGYYKTGDVVFVGITSPLRDMIIDDKGQIYNFIGSHIQPTFESLFDAMITLNNKYQVALNNMIILRSLQAVLQQENIPCVFIETHPYSVSAYGEHSNETFLRTETDIDLIIELKKIYQDVIDRLNLVPVGTMYKYQGEKCAYGHASVEHHQLFATELYDYLIKPK